MAVFVVFPNIEYGCTVTIADDAVIAQEAVPNTEPVICDPDINDEVT